MERRKSNDLPKNKIINIYLNEAFQQSESFLISQKSFLEIILEQIKNHQNFFLSEKNNRKILKLYLNKMKNNLSSILDDKTFYQKYLEKEIKLKKAKVQNELNPKLINKNKKKNRNSYNSIDSINYNHKNQKDLSIEKDINYINEKKQLENLCFRAENEIEKIGFENQEKIDLIINLRTPLYFQEENLEIITDQKNLISKAGRIMKLNFKNYQKNLIKITRKKIKIDLKIKKTINKINFIKEQIKNEQEYIHSDEIISEESSDYTKSIIIDNNLINSNQDEIENQYIINNNTKRKCNRKSLDILYNINNKLYLNNNINNNKTNLNDKNEEISVKMIRSDSNKIKKINLQEFKNNCRLINFSINNFNIINGEYIEDKEKNINLTFNNDSLNKKINDENQENLFEKNNLKYENHSDKD